MIVFAYMKKIIYSAFIALSLCACDSNKDESFNSTPEIPASPVVYHVNLPASFDAQTRAVTFGSDGKSITTQFEKGDRIYVYNEIKGAWARYADGSLSYLQPTNISGSTCTLVGDFSFYNKMDGQDEWELVTVDDDDTYSLYYQMNEPDYKFFSKYIPRFNYENQDGSAESASKCDFAEKKGVPMTLTGNTLTTSIEIPFQNLQSMFRQHLSFTKNGTAVTPTITKLTVGTKNETLLLHYRPNIVDSDEFQAFDAFEIDDPQITADGDIYLSLAFYYTNDCPASGDQLILTAVDDEGNVYLGAKAVPTGGFEKSKYYYGNCELTWKTQIVKPTVSRSDGGDDDELDPYNNGLFDFTGDPAKITISGNSTGYYFKFGASAEVTLTGNGTAISDNEYNNFIYAKGDLTIVLGSDYSIICSNYDPAIESKKNLKLKTTGNEQKLTITTNDYEDVFGICGRENYDNWQYVDLSNLEVDGFTITRSDVKDNNDGTYTWVYTVTPNE